MTWYKIANSTPVVAFLTKKLRQPLEEGKVVLWLVSGGSVIPLAAAVARQLQPVNCNHLIVSLMDERYGEVGHTDENWHKLLAAGFSLPNAHMRAVLQGESPEATTADFAAFMRQALAKADFRIGLFGMGADGHTAGILPHSPAVTNVEYACYYPAETYRRITITPPVIAALDSAVLYAVGSDKQVALEELQEPVSIADQPAQALKTVAEFTIFNDHLGVST